MLLTQLRVVNVGLYRGAQTVDFSRDKRRPVTLIGGKNGAGKTTLLNSIPLVLYGNRSKVLLGASAYPEYLHGLIHADCANASVALEFERRERGRTVRYVIERQWARSVTGKSADRLEVTVDDKPRPDLEANWSEFVEGIMPLSVSGLAIFDGEKIEALADVGNSADVLRTSLYGLLGLDLVERLQRDLGEYRRKQAHRALPNHPALAVGLAEAEDRLSVTMEEVDAHQAELRHVERRKELADAELESAEERLANAGGDLFAMRERLHAELVAAEAASAANARRLETMVSGDLPLLTLRSLLAQVVGMGERSQLANEAALLLSRMKERDDRIVEQLEVRGDEFPPSIIEPLAALLTEDRRKYEIDNSGGFDVSPGATLLARELLGDAGEDLLHEARELVSGINAAGVARELARRSLNSVPTGDAFEEIVRAVADAESRVTAAEGELRGAHDRVAEADRKALTAQRDVDRLATELLEAGAADSDAVRIAREVDRAETTLERFSARVIERNLGRITRNITESLRCLLRKEGLVAELSIDPATLEIALFGRDKRPLSPGRLSAGERQMLATAVLWGLSKSTGRTLPTVIDTPVGRLDRSHRTNLVTRYFATAARQVVLLSTDEEIVGEYLRQLEPSIGRQYLLSYDDQTDATEIVEGYFE